MTIRFGILPQVETCICMDLDWLDGSVLFPEALPGGLKIVCHGRRIDKSQVKRVKLVTIPCFHEVAVRLSKPELLADIPAGFIEEVSPNLPVKNLWILSDRISKRTALSMAVEKAEIERRNRLFHKIQVK